MNWPTQLNDILDEDLLFAKEQCPSEFQKKEREEAAKFGECAICYDAPRTHVFVPCGHACVCKSCGSEVMRRICTIDTGDGVFLSLSYRSRYRWAIKLLVG